MRGGEGVKQPPAQHELALAMDLRVAGQDVLEESRARPRQADDENHPFRVQTCPSRSREEVGAVGADQGIDELYVYGRLKAEVGWRQGQFQSISLAEAGADA